MTHHYDLPAHVLLDPGASCSSVAIIDPDQADAWEATFDRLQQKFHSLRIIHICRMYDKFETLKDKSHAKVGVAPGKFLPPIIAMGATSLRGFD